MQTYMITLYKRLLADISLKSGVSIDAPEEISDEWVLIEAPKLDKLVLGYLEGDNREVVLPEWLMPLWVEFVRSDDPVLLRYLRMCLVFCYKTERPTNNEQRTKAEEAFLETETGCGVWNRAFKPDSASATLRSARKIVGSVIYRVNWERIVPSHGPGGIFPTRLPRDKSRFLTIYESIQERYPADQYFCGLPSFWDSYFWHETHGELTIEKDIVSKLVCVPKDSRGPRLISVHPAEAIWIQQGQRKLLEDAITRSNRTRGRINFTDQTVNGKLCLASSGDRKFCTIDLKEASDRVSTSLVRFLFGDYAYGWLSCARSNKLKLTDGRVISLEKWAPMGNALCFPVESLVFFSLAVAGIRDHYGVNCSDVYVFGDDIIVPSEYFEGVIRALVSAGLVPNRSKCFVKGFFRESCGVEAYKGIDITPLRLRHDDIVSLSTLTSLTDLALRLRRQGFSCVAKAIYSTVRSQLRRAHGISLPYTNDPETGHLVEYIDVPFTELLLAEPALRYNARWQRWVVRAGQVKSPQHVVTNGEWYHLQDGLLRLERKFGSYDHDSKETFRGCAEICTFSDRPTEYPVPYRARLTYGWAGCLVGNQH